MRKIVLCLLTLFIGIVIAKSQGFTISGTQLIDANGNNFIIRGFAAPLSWFVSDVNNNIAKMKNVSNANCIRIVINTTTTDANWQACVKKCIANKMIPMVELHDITCGTTSSGLADMAKWWLKKKTFLTNPEISRYILINIANEWGDWAMAKDRPAYWRDAYIDAVSILRRGGIKTTLVIDAPDCGQDLLNAGTLKAHAMTVFNSDSLKNCLFSVHLYGEWETTGGSKPANLPSIKKAGIPFIVGEYCSSVNDAIVMDSCQANGIGWMAWSWKGNTDPTDTDMSADWSGENLTLWGNTAINEKNGLRHTAHIASVFAGDSGCVRTTIKPYVLINDGKWAETATAELKTGDSVMLGPLPASGGTWKWNAPGGYTDTVRELSLINVQPDKSGFYIASFTSDNGCISDTAIHISIIASEAKDTVISGATYKIVSKFSGKTLDIANSDTASGAIINQMAINDGLSQEWIITDIGTGNYMVRSAISGKALNVLKAAITNGAAIEQLTFSNTTSQKWKFVKDNNGYYQIINGKSKKCINIRGASITDNAEMVQFPCYNMDNQKFTLIKTKDPLPDTTTIIPDIIKSNIKLYPNPSDGTFKIEGLNEGLLEILDLNGRLIQSHVIASPDITVNSNLKTGAYFVKVTENKTISLLKLVIE